MSDYGMRDRELRTRGLLAGEGFWVLERMLHLELVKVFVAKASLERVEKLFSDRRAGAFGGMIEVMDRKELSETAGYPFHRGVYALARRPQILRVDGDTGMPLLGCIDIRDPDNLGSLIRSAAAFGCGGIMITPKSADIFSRKVIRTSMAHVLRLPVYLIQDSGELKLLKEKGYTVTASGLGPGFRELGGRTGKPWDGQDRNGENRDERNRERSPAMKRKRVILMGNEAEGLSPEWVEAADEACSIPMAGGVDSLNVGVAGGIMLWELLGKGT